MRAQDTRLCPAAFQQQIASEGEVAFWPHVWFKTVLCAPKAGTDHLLHPQPLLPKQTVVFIRLLLEKGNRIIGLCIGCTEPFLVFVPLLQLFTLTEVLIKAQAIHTAGALWG